MSQPTQEKSGSQKAPSEPQMDPESRDVLMHMRRDGALQSFMSARKRGDYPWFATVEGGSQDRLPSFPKLHPSDVRKLRRTPEPRRASEWLRMSFVACEGSYLDFSQMYVVYRSLVESDPDGDISIGRPRMWKDQTSGEKKRPGDQFQDEEREEASPEEQVGGEQEAERQPVEKEPFKKQPVKKQPTQTQWSQESKKRDPSANPMLAPRVSCSEFFQILLDTVHGVRIYCRTGRLHSWSHEDFINSQKFLVLGICTRKEGLTFSSTSRKRNLNQVKRFKKKGQLIFPEGDPNKRSTFSKKLAQDPLLMLPKDVQSFWMKWKMRETAYYDGKWSEDSAFPGVSMYKNRLLERPVAAKAGPSTGSAGPDQMPVKPEPTHNVEANPDQQQLPPKGKGKQKREDSEPTDNCQPTAANVSQQDASIVATSTRLKRKRSLGDPSRKPTTPASPNRPVCKSCGKKKATSTDAKNCQKACCSAKKDSTNMTCGVDSKETEELVQRLGELGIKSDRPRSQLEVNAESGETKKRADSSDVSEAVALVAQASSSLLTVTEELGVEMQADSLLAELRRWDQWS